jgi:hypothetical protein
VIYILILRENVILHPNRFKAFAVKNISELFGYIATGKINIRIHRDIEGKIWFGSGVGHVSKLNRTVYCVG